MYLPFVICNVMDLQKLEDVWTNPLARELQKDVEDKKFTWCAVEHCRIMDRSLHHDFFQKIQKQAQTKCNATDQCLV